MFIFDVKGLVEEIRDVTNEVWGGQTLSTSDYCVYNTLPHKVFVIKNIYRIYYIINSKEALSSSCIVN